MAGRIAYYGNIVKDGLVLCLDAAKKDSYPGSGTTWRDVSGFSRNGTLVNGPTFNSDNGGSIAFDGTNDYVSFASTTLTSGACTGLFWINGNYSGYKLSIYERNVGRGAGLTTSIPANGWCQVGFVSTQAGNQFVINGTTYSANAGGNNIYDFSTFIPVFWIGNVNLFAVNSGPWTSFHLQPTNSGNGSFTWLDYGIMALGVSATVGNPRYFNGRHGVIHLYNRALSASEVLQNYNATKGRYGL